MATEKSKSLKWLSIHVAVYGSVTILSAIFIAVKLDNYFFGFSWLIMNVALHFIVDLFTSKVTSHLWEQKNMHWFFVMIGFDQLIHNICLLGTFYILKTNLISF